MMNLRDDNGYVRKSMRMLPYMLITAALLAVAFHIRPDQFGVSVYNVSRVTLAAWLAYWIDMALAANAWPRLFWRDLNAMPAAMAAAMILRRPLIFIGCITGLGAIG